MFNKILPKCVIVVQAEGRMWTDQLHAEEEAIVSEAIEKQKREFRAGRNAAKQALRSLGFSAPFSILRTKFGAPIWPLGIVGSITHTGGYCAVAVTPASKFACIGIDVEASKELEDCLLSIVCTQSEIHWIENRSRRESVFPWGKLFFSCKESIYKALNPLVSQFLDFHDISLNFNESSRTFNASVTLECGTRIMSLHGCFAIDNSYVYSSIVVKNPGLPRLCLTLKRVKI